MIKREDYKKCQQLAAKMIADSGIVIKDEEIQEIQVADFGFSDIYNIGIEIFTFYVTERTSAKVLVLLPNQTEPEHWHPPVGDDPGKEEIIRAIAGNLRFYTPGKGVIKEGFIPNGKEACFTMKNEILLKPGDQLILPPGTKHWFQAGDKGAVMYSFSTCVRDGLDKFTDPSVVRETIIID